MTHSSTTTPWWNPSELTVPEGAPEDLVDMARGFEPPVLTRRTRLDLWRAQALAGVLRAPVPAPGDPLPLGWHEVYLRDPLATGDLAEDGHAASHALMPPRRPRRRVYAGATLALADPDRPLLVEDEVERSSGVVGCDLVEGRTGWLMIITESHRYAVDGTTRVEERRRVALRHDAPEASASGTSGASGKSAAKPKVANDAAPQEDPSAFVVEKHADPTLLFRFSALTYNPHRIHYDHAYATGVEGHADLLVHGPLTALWGLEAVRASGALPHAPAAWDFRLRGPAYLGGPVRFVVTAGEDATGGTATVTASQQGRLVLTGTAR